MRIPLNGVVKVELDGLVDPLTVTMRSVQVTRMDGTELPVIVTCVCGQLQIQLVVSNEYFSGQLKSIWLELAGLPSPNALGTLDGRRLRSTIQRRIDLEPLLVLESTDPPTLVAINGMAMFNEPLIVGTEIVLTFDGILDPQSVTAAGCPMFPNAGDLTLLSPLNPEASWECVGNTFSVVLTIPPASGLLHFTLRRCALRDTAGRLPEPSGLSIALLSR